MTVLVCLYCNQPSELPGHSCRSCANLGHLYPLVLEEHRVVCGKGHRYRTDYGRTTCPVCE